MRPTLVNPYTPPTTPLEARLADMWAEVLDLESVGVEDRFTDLGGHSLAAVRLLAALNEMIGRELPFSVLLEAGTVRELATVLETVLETGEWAPRWTSLVQVQAGDGRPPLFLVPPAASTSLGFAKFAKALGPEQGVYAFDPLGLVGQSEPHNTVEAMAAHYIDEMRRLQPKGPYLLGGRCFGAHVALEMAVHLQEAGQDVPLLAVLDAAPPQAGPTWTGEESLLWHPDNRWTHLRFRVKEKGAARVVYHAVRRRYVKMQQRSRRQAVSESVLAAHRTARRVYRAKPVRGRMVVYLSEVLADAGSRQRWAELAAGECEIVALPESFHSETLRADTSLRVIAQHLRGELERATAEMV